ncbi:hypothetical protein CAPTEDRAFT_189639 [Capitella teleta]|uniref:Uncharacterized protein n=1 Tax=Capitella teleta TaxID=283909 RepID=R7TA71_CAPTE|nr:hypothetical protein CAPTEDRAFT_189639 [Capitella teleta]|eukprot:ELT90377.1 hypothetical protein CAPTEDRAFT_189639 [Capitella teleta]
MYFLHSSCGAIESALKTDERKRHSFEIQRLSIALRRVIKDKLRYMNGQLLLQVKKDCCAEHCRFSVNGQLLLQVKKDCCAEHCCFSVNGQLLLQVKKDCCAEHCCFSVNGKLGLLLQVKKDCCAEHFCFSVNGQLLLQVKKDCCAEHCCFSVNGQLLLQVKKDCCAEHCCFSVNGQLLLQHYQITGPYSFSIEDATPYTDPPRKFAIHVKEQLKGELDKMTTQGVIGRNGDVICVKLYVMFSGYICQDDTWFMNKHY